MNRHRSAFILATICLLCFVAPSRATLMDIPDARRAYDEADLVCKAIVVAFTDGDIARVRLRVLYAFKGEAAGNEITLRMSHDFDWNPHEPWQLDLEPGGGPSLLFLRRADDGAYVGLSIDSAIYVSRRPIARPDLRLTGDNEADAPYVWLWDEYKAAVEDMGVLGYHRVHALGRMRELKVRRKETTIVMQNCLMLGRGGLRYQAMRWLAAEDDVNAIRMLVKEILDDDAAGTPAVELRELVSYLTGPEAAEYLMPLLGEKVAKETRDAALKAYAKMDSAVVTAACAPALRGNNVALQYEALRQIVSRNPGALPAVPTRDEFLHNPAAYLDPIHEWWKRNHERIMKEAQAKTEPRP